MACTQGVWGLLGPVMENQDRAQQTLGGLRENLEDTGRT